MSKKLNKLSKFKNFELNRELMDRAKADKYSDESFVEVISPLGQSVGFFLYPKKDTKFLLEHNKVKSGFYFVVDGKPISVF